MAVPFRFVVCTYNIWAEYRWPEREAALQHFIELHQPDILCLQELHPVTRQLLDRALPSHRRVEDAFAGWLIEGNIYWNSALFELVEYGAEPIGIVEEFRRLFWVRLRLPTPAAATLLVATAHFTWPGHASEQASGANSRIPQAEQAVVALNRLAKADEPVLFMGDLNEFYHPLRILRAGGFTDCFSALGQPPRPTWPALPTSKGTAEVLDWLLHRGPIRPMLCEVVDFYRGDFAPSDHKPVMATYSL